MAQGEYHIQLKKMAGAGVAVTSLKSGPTNGHIPSVDVLFESAVGLSLSIAAVLLTGMGRDGANGMYELGKRGAMTYAQSEESCVVFGMPKEAIKRGNVRFVGDLDEIREGLLASFKIRAAA